MREIKDNTIVIGRQNDSDIDIAVSHSTETEHNPKIRFDVEDAKFKVSHDGINFEEITSKEYVDTSVGVEAGRIDSIAGELSTYIENTDDRLDSLELIPDEINRIDTALDERPVGPSSSSDNRLVRWDGVTGKAVKNSVATLSDAGALSGLTGLTVTGQSNFYGETNQLGPLNLTSTVSNSQSGTAITIALTSSNNIRLEGNVVSIAGYVAFGSGRITYITNNTPDSIIVLNESGSAASPSNRIITGTESDIKLGKGATLQLIYDAVAQRHKVVGAVDNKGSKSLSTLMQLTADESLSDWTFLNNDLSISKVDPLFGDASYVLEMANLASATYKVIPVDIGFRGTTVALTLNYLMPQGSARVRLLDQVNEVIATFDIPTASGKEKFGTTVFIPNDVTGIRFQAESRDTIEGQVFKFDNVQLSEVAGVNPSVAVSDSDIDWSKGFVYHKEVTTAITLTQSNVVDGKTISVIMYNTSASIASITMPSGVLKSPDFPTSISAGKTIVVTLMSGGGKTVAVATGELE